MDASQRDTSPLERKITCRFRKAILQPGSSGQAFEMGTLERIAAVQAWPERSHFDVCVDGGVTEGNVGLLNVEIVVSGSSVLKSADPRRQIMRLQTSSNYEQA